MPAFAVGETAPAARIAPAARTKRLIALPNFFLLPRRLRWSLARPSRSPSQLPVYFFLGSTLGMTTFVVIFFGSNLIKHVGWRAGALATPVSMAMLAAPLFGVVIASKV